MKIYLISQSRNSGYDTYDSAVVIAPSKAAARKIKPDDPTWCDPKYVWVEFIGEARRNETKPRIVCASFNAG